MQNFICLQEEDENNETDGIDFGDNANGGDGIDFGGDDIDFGDDNDGGAEIDFGDSGAAEIDFGVDDDGPVEPVTLDLDNVDTSAIVLEEGGIQGGVARDQEALTLLDNRRTRIQIVDELEELAGFLTQRLLETENASIKFNMAAGSGDGGQAHDAGSLRRLLASVEAMLAKLTAVKMQQLQMIRDSPSYADRLADTFKQKLRLKDKVVASIDVMQRRIDEAEQERLKGVEQIRLLQARVKEWAGEVEKDISKRYKGRKVTISGL